MSGKGEDKTGPALHPETLAAQGLGRIDAVTRAVVPPLHPSTTYVRDPDGGYRSGRGYTRADNPSYDTPEDLIATLEGGDSCLLFSSGMSAAAAVFQSLLPGDHVIAPRTMYWALRKWLNDFPLSWGLEVEFVDTTDSARLAAAMRPGQTRIVWLETPANPTWEISDVEAAARLAHAAGARLVVDSTVATPVQMRPLALGADLVVHSASKYLNGHSDVLAGAVVCARRDALWFRIRAWQRDGGSVLGPFEAWLLLRGMRTLFPRVRHSTASALHIAQHFDGHPLVDTVLYPGLPSHPGHAIAKRQMSGGFGGMLSLRVAGGESAAVATAGAVQVFKRATSLGGVESLVEHRASIEGAASPVPDDLLRLSVGLEKVEDLIADLEQALAAGQAAAAPGAGEPAGRGEPRPTGSAPSDPALAEAVATLIRPVIQDRGGDVQLRGQRGGTVLLEVSGSPGAALPLERWAGAVLAQRFDAVRRVRISGPRAGKASAPDAGKDAGKDAAARAQATLDAWVNPAIASHGGRIVARGLREGRLEVELQGRCQGCAMAEVTLRQGVEPLLREHLPEVATVRDATDHGAGANPYFSPGKGGGAQ